MSAINTLLVEPLGYEFMLRALLIASLVGTVCAILSCFLILKGWSLMGDAVSHAVLPGLILAYMAGIPLVVGAIVAGLGCSLATGYLKTHSRVREDAVMGIVFSGMFALGLVMLTRVESNIHLLHVLFGNMLGASWADITETALIAGLALLLLVLKGRALIVYFFDPAHARAIGLPVGLLHNGFLLVLSLVIVAALKAAGIILVVAMLIAPGAIALLVSRRFTTMVVIAVSVSLLTCFLGTLISFHIDAATAPLIVVIQAMVFIMALLFTLIRQRSPRSAP